MYGGQLVAVEVYSHPTRIFGIKKNTNLLYGSLDPEYPAVLVVRGQRMDPVDKFSMR
jgi:hypothetical protein